MSFNFFMTKRVFRVGQYDGIDDFVAFHLSGKKRPLGQFLVGEFHSSAICKRFNPLVAHSAPPKWRFSRPLVAISFGQSFQDRPLAGPSLDMTLVPLQERVRFA